MRVFPARCFLAAQGDPAPRAVACERARPLAAPNSAPWTASPTPGSAPWTARGGGPPPGRAAPKKVGRAGGGHHDSVENRLPPPPARPRRSPRRPWAWYAKPNQDCALAGLFSLSFSELYRAKSGHLRTINDLNIPILFAIGAAMRVVSYLLLLLCNRDKMGKQTILQLLAQFFLNPVSDLLDDVVGAWERGFGRKRRGERV